MGISQAAPVPPVIPGPYVDVPFQSGFSDVSGNGFNSTDFGSGTVADWGFPKQGGNCLQVSAGASTVKFAYTGTSFTGEHSHSIWVKTPSYLNSGYIMKMIRNSGSSKLFSAFSYGSTYAAFAGVATTDPQISNGSWKHVCAVFEDATTTKIYVDGVLVETAVDIATTYLFDAILGSSEDVCYFARMRMWNVALTQEQVLAEYNRS